MSTPKGFVIVANSQSAYRVLRPHMLADVEEVWAVVLTSSKLVLDVQCIFRGTVDACMIHPRDIFRFAYLRNASCLLVAHNHPSGDLTPSPEDLLWTERLVAAGKILQVPVLDHLILNRSSYLSMADYRFCKFAWERGDSGKGSAANSL